MGILKSYDLKINGMGRVVYLKKPNMILPKRRIPLVFLSSGIGS